MVYQGLWCPWTYCGRAVSETRAETWRFSLTFYCWKSRKNVEKWLIHFLMFSLFFFPEIWLNKLLAAASINFLDLLVDSEPKSRTRLTRSAEMSRQASRTAYSMRLGVNQNSSSKVREFQFLLQESSQLALEHVALRKRGNWLYTKHTDECSPEGKVFQLGFGICQPFFFFWRHEISHFWAGLKAVSKCIHNMKIHETNDSYSVHHGASEALLCLSYQKLLAAASRNKACGWSILKRVHHRQDSKDFITLEENEIGKNVFGSPTECLDTWLNGCLIGLQMQMDFLMVDVILTEQLLGTE